MKLHDGKDKSMPKRLNVALPEIDANGEIKAGAWTLRNTPVGIEAERNEPRQVIHYSPNDAVAFATALLALDWA